MLQCWQLFLSCCPKLLQIPSFRHIPVLFHYEQSGKETAWYDGYMCALNVPCIKANIVPVLVTNHTVTIGVELVRQY
jgi:hypothetical protein